MPKNKFDAFYYGIGMKLDEASIDQAGKQLEGRLNQVVDRITQKVSTISNAITKGVKDVDTKDLVKSIADAQKELTQFQNFDPSKLQQQIGKLSGTVSSLGDQFKDVSNQLNNFVNDVTSRLSNIEIKTSQQGIKALKTDLDLMKEYAQQMSKSKNIDTTGLEKYFQRVKDGFASIKASGNPMELFADKEIARYFVDLTNILRQMGDPVKQLRSDFFDLSSTFKTSFEKANVSGSKSVFKNIGYQIESVNLELKKSEAQLESYRSKIDELNRRRRTSGFAVAIEDKDLDFDQKIKKIQEYDDAVTQFDPGDGAWYDVFKKQIALIQAAEKELATLSKGANGAQYIKKWTDTFGYNIDDDKFSQYALSQYVEQAQEDIVSIGKLYGEAYKEFKNGRTKLDSLMAKEGLISSQSNKNKTTKASTAKVDIQAKINEAEWAKTINAALTNLEASKKVKPFKIKVEATQGKILDEVKKIKEATLMDKKNNGEKDVVQFNKNFDKFITNIKDRKQELIDELKKNWHPALKDAFSFKMELLGIDNKSMTENINAHMLSTVDAINAAFENKPIIFHSNIDDLIDEIKEKLTNLKLDSNIEIGAGNVSINPQGLSNANIIVNGIVGNTNNVTPSVASPPTPPSAPPTTPSSSNKLSIPTINNNNSKQAIYNDAVSRINKMLTETTNPAEALQKVKQAARSLYEKLINAEEGTQEYYEAQIQLTTLLSKWRYKIGGPKADAAFKVPGIMGKGKQPAINWNKYLVDNGIIPDPKNSRIISSQQKLRDIYGLTDYKASSTSKRTKITKTNGEMTPEERSVAVLGEGKKIIEYFVNLAKLGKNLNLISEIAAKPITADMFNDDSLTKWIRGKVYTKEDIGSYAPGKKITSEALDEFLSTMGITEADLAEANTKEEVEFLTPLKKYIYAFIQNRQKLNELLTTLTETQSGKMIADEYNAASSDKTEYLAGNLSAAIKSLTPQTPKTKAQQYVSDVFKKYNIDLSQLPSAKTYAEQWQIIQQQLIGKKGLNFDNLMSELGQLKGNVGKTYDNFMTLLKVSRAYMETSNSLSEVGREASLLIRGRTEKVDTKRRRWNNQTGQYDDIEGEVAKTVQQGIRGLLKQLKVVFEGENGQTLLGYNLGKGYIQDDKFLSADSTFTKIIEKLTAASNNASKILFGERMSMISGSKDVDTYKPSSSKSASTYKPNTVAYTERQELEGKIAHLENTKKYLEEKLTSINQQLSTAGLTVDKLQKITEISSQISQKRNDVLANKNRIEKTAQEIDGLKNEIANPETTYEDILTQELQNKEELIELKRELSQKQKGIKSGEYNREIEQLSTKIASKQMTAQGLENSAKVAKRGSSDDKIANLILQQENELITLKNELTKQKEDIKYQSNKQEINRLVQEKEPLLERISTLRAEIQQIKNDANGKLSGDQKNLISQKEQEVQKLLGQTTEYQKQITSLRLETSPYDESIYDLEQKISAKKKYIESLQQSLKHRKKVKTPEEFQNALSEKTVKLNNLQEQQTKLESELSSLTSELGNFGVTATVDEIVQMLAELENIKSRIANVGVQLNNYKKDLQNANSKSIKYNKSYDQALADLPKAQVGQTTARENLATLVNQYTQERMSTITDALTKKQLGTLSDKEAKSIQDTLYNIVTLNERLQKGTMTYEEYVKKVADAYILMRNATTEEAKVTADSDAKKLADAVLLVKEYEKELNLLNDIIKTQKPKDQPIIQSTGQNQGSTKTQSRTTVQPGNNPSSTLTMSIGNSTPMSANSNAVLNVVGSGLSTEPKQDVIIELLKNGIKITGGSKDTNKSGEGPTSDGKKSRLPQMPNIAKVSLQADEISKLTNINKESSLYQQYAAAKKQLDEAVVTVVAKGNNRTKEDTDKIRALSSTVTSLGKQIINAANSFDKFKNRGGEAFSYVQNKVDNLETKMRELAYGDALKSGSLLKDISYDKVTQKLSYNLTDLEGNITRVTMAYEDLLGVVLKTSDKTTTSASKIYNAIEGEITQRIRVNDILDMSPQLDDTKQYQNYIDVYNSMKEASETLRNKGTMATKEDKERLISLINKTIEARTEFEQLAKASDDFYTKIKDKKFANVQDENNLEAEMKQFVLGQEGLTESQKRMIESTWSFKNAQDGATYSVRKGKDQVASMSVIFNQGTKQIGQYTVETNKYRTGMEKFMDSLRGKWQEVARYLMSFGSLYRIWAVLKQGIQYIREIDSALTELKKVTDETEETYDRFLNTAAKTADKVGSTIKEVVSSTADWARLNI